LIAVQNISRALIKTLRAQSEPPSCIHFMKSGDVVGSTFVPFGIAHQE
jgi:hypothetical protein